jgi:hypothetical protein
VTLSVDAARAEISGPDEDIRALLASDEPVEVEPPLLADGIRAARAPAARFHVTGFEDPLEAVADARAGALILARPGGTTALRACTPSGLLGLLVRAVGLRPRPRVDVAAMTVPSRVLAERSAEDPLLQEQLEALRAHWRIEAYGPAHGWYLEVLDGELGLWTVEAAGKGEVTLTPTDATAVLDELAALPGHGGLGPS